LALLAAGAGIAFFTLRPAPPNATAQKPSSGTAPAASPPAPGPAPDVVVTLTPEATRAAGIVLTTVTTRRGLVALRLPGGVQAHAYKQVVVTPLVGGRVTPVLPRP